MTFLKNFFWFLFLPLSIFASDSTLEIQKKVYTRALVIGGSDSFGGAGVQADLKTFSALGCYGMNVITAVTAQNSQGVQGVHLVPDEFVAKQIKSILSDPGANVVKLSMLASSSLIKTVIPFLEKIASMGISIVHDPVIFSKHGYPLLNDEKAIEVLKNIFPYTSVITPNRREAEKLTGVFPLTRVNANEAAKKMLSNGGVSVLIKGLERTQEKIVDYLFCNGQEKFFENHIVDTNNLHGTGCTLSAAIAAHMAHGCSVETAIIKARKYTHEALSEGADYRIGLGYGPVHHFYRIWSPLLVENFSKIVWRENKNIYQAIVEHPFNVELADGCLDINKFKVYIQQDYLYLIDFARSLSIVAGRCCDEEDILSMLDFAKGAIETRKVLHSSYMKRYAATPLSEKEKNKACLTYTSYLLNVVSNGCIEEALAALLPCFWVYQEVGKHIKIKAAKQNNPYKEWINTYNSSDYENIVMKMINFVDKYASDRSRGTFDKMKLSFRQCMQMEYDFWEDSYRLVKSYTSRFLP